MKYTPLSLGTLLLFAVSIPTGCGEDPPVIAGEGDGDKDEGDGDEDEGDGDGSCEVGDTMEDCSENCGDLGSVSVCIEEDGETLWSRCECVPPDEDVDTNPDDKPCKAGYYTGDFTGEYWSGAFDIGFGSLFKVEVVAKAGEPGEGLNITLEEYGEQGNEADEFAPELGVKNGCVKGVAVAYGTNNPFVGTLTGELDCDSGKFDGYIKGYYRLLDSDIIYHFEGPTPGQYNPDKQALELGTWKVVEHMMYANAPGGSGIWNGNWAADENPNPLPEECKKLIEENGGDGDGDNEADAGT